MGSGVRYVCETETGARPTAGGDNNVQTGCRAPRAKLIHHASNTNRTGSTGASRRTNGASSSRQDNRAASQQQTQAHGSARRSLGAARRGASQTPLAGTADRRHLAARQRRRRRMMPRGESHSRKRRLRGNRPTLTAQQRAIRSGPWRPTPRRMAQLHSRAID